MNATSLYVSTCRLVLQANPEDPGCCTDLYRLIPYLRQSLSCTVCGNLLIEPYTPTETNCQHHVCRTCKGGKKKLKPSCSWCKNYDKYIENVQLRILLQCYKKLCEYIMNSTMYRLMCKSTASSAVCDANIANVTDLIQEGAGFKDEFKSNTGLSKSAYSILPCIYASASTQTITQSAGTTNEIENLNEEDAPISRSSLSNGSSIYSVTYAGSGNKMVIKRKAMLNKGEMENCENFRLLKGPNIKRPGHRRGFRGRGRTFKYDDRNNSASNNNNNSSISGSISSGRMNAKKKKLGCRCGNATASPGKLTCCGQRCPCYVDSKACLDCKCRGCRNPHTKEGQKVIAKVIREPLDSGNCKIQSPAHLQADDSIPAEVQVPKTEGKLSHQKRQRCSEVSEVTQDEFNQPNEIKITIKVESLENIDTCKTTDVMIKMDFNGETLAQTEKIKFKSNLIDIQLVGSIHTENVDPKFMNDLLGNPIIFTVYDCSSISPSPVPPPSAKQDIKKKTAKTTASRVSLSATHANQSVLGTCNLDMGCLMSGKDTLRETLVVEMEKNAALKDTVTWIKLPKLIVTASIDDKERTFHGMNENYNIVGVTVESVYNLPESMNEGIVFDAIIPVPSFGDKTNTLTFANGSVVSNKDLDGRKKWNSLQQMESQGSRTKYQINESSCDIISSLPIQIDLEEEMGKRQAQLDWKSWTRCFITRSDCHYFYSKLMKYHVWPIEITVANRTSGPRGGKSEKKSKPAVGESQASFDHFTAFLNFSALLYPGVKKVRAAAQLFTYSQSDLATKFGVEFSPTQSQSSVGTTAKGKAMSQKSTNDAEDKKIDSSGLPLTNKEGNPTFIVVEIEFLKAFTRQKSPEALEKELMSFVCLKSKIPMKLMNFQVAEKGFSTSIQNIISLMVQEYNNFVNHNKSIKSHEKVRKPTFYEFLRCRETFNKAVYCLETKVLTFIHEKYGEWPSINDKLPEIYVDLIENMHKITNKFVLGVSNTSYRFFNTGSLQLFAEEAVEEGDYKLAKKYILLKISKDKSHPDYWLDYAVFCTRINDYETAVEAIREALTLDVYHQMGLLLYALLMGKLGNGLVAEVTFQFLLSKYPNYVEGWKAFHLFYVSNQNYEGGDVTLQMSKKVEKERLEEEKANTENIPVFEKDKFSCKHYVPPESYTLKAEGSYGIGTFVNGFSWSEPLSWSSTFCPPNNINVRTTILMLKLGFPEFGSMTLAEDLLANGLSPCPFYQYYRSVIYYLQGNYNEAICNLEMAVNEYGKDSCLWSLMGHCYYKLEDHANAITCYEYVMESYNRLDDVHLIYLRLGNYYLETSKYICAKKAFSAGCKYSPSPRLWKGAGIACLRLEEYEEAEVAFGEANYLDNTDPEIWGYLALVNGLLRRLDMLAHCFWEAKKRMLKNNQLIKEIEGCINLSHFQMDE